MVWLQSQEVNFNQKRKEGLEKEHAVPFSFFSPSSSSSSLSLSVSLSLLVLARACPWPRLRLTCLSISVSSGVCFFRDRKAAKIFPPLGNENEQNRRLTSAFYMEATQHVFLLFGRPNAQDTQDKSSELVVFALLSRRFAEASFSSSNCLLKKKNQGAEKSLNLKISCRVADSRQKTEFL